jgi:PHP family Zn ribbon phosphoesterase
MEEILKADHERNMQDLEKMARLVETIQADERKNAHHAVSLQTIGNLEQVEKLSRSIRARMKRD